MQCLPLEHNFFTAQTPAATPWDNMYFPEQAALHAVNSVFFKRLEETLDEQTKDVIQQKQAELHTHNIAVTAEVPANELRQIMVSINPDAPVPPTAGLEEATRQAFRAEGLRLEVGLNHLFQTH